MSEINHSDRDILTAVGQTLYGSRWQSDMARSLGVSDRTVRRWAADGAIPAGVWSDIAGLLDRRAAALASIMPSIERMAQIHRQG